jgi:hypothetical protein
MHCGLRIQIEEYQEILENRRAADSMVYRREKIQGIDLKEFKRGTPHSQATYKIEEVRHRKEKS